MDTFQHSLFLISLLKESTGQHHTSRSSYANLLKNHETCDGAPAIASGLLAKGRCRRSNRPCGDTPAEGHWNMRDGGMRRRLRDDVTYLSLGYLSENRDAVSV